MMHCRHTVARPAALLAGGCLLLAALLGGCTRAPRPEAASAPSGTAQAPSAPAAVSATVSSATASSATASSAAAPQGGLTVRFRREDDAEAPRERGIAEGVDSAGTVQWRHETAWQEMTELARVEGIGENGGRYYLNEGGTVVALDIATGAVLWSNPDFGGASLCAAFREDGGLLLCGYYGPHLFWVDRAGQTVCRIGTLDEGYFWPTDIWEEDGRICVAMEGTPDGIGSHVLRVDPQDVRAAP